MGNAASREAAKLAQKAGGKSSAAAAAAAKAPRPPPLGRAVADAPEVIEDAEAPLRQRQQQETQHLLQPEPRRPPAPIGGHPSSSSGPPRPLPHPPQPDQHTGFFRGQLTDPRDVSQEQFLVHQSGGKKEMQELAPDLLKFLQEAGPLEKKLNTKQTSPRVVKDLELEGEQSEKMHRFEAAQRTRTDMNLVKNIDGHTTSRTTNFFSSPDDDEDLKDFGFNDLDIYELLKRCQAGNNAAECGDVVASFYEETRGKQAEAVGWTKEEQEEQQKMLKDTAKFLHLPVIIKDEDANYIGMDRKELEKEFAHQKIDIVDEGRVKLVLADLNDLQRKEIRRIR